MFHAFSDLQFKQTHSGKKIQVKMQESVPFFLQS